MVFRLSSLHPHLTKCSGVLPGLSNSQVQAAINPHTLPFSLAFTASLSDQSHFCSLVSASWPWHQGCLQPSTHLLFYNLHPACFQRVEAAHWSSKKHNGVIRKQRDSSEEDKGNRIIVALHFLMMILKGKFCLLYFLFLFRDQLSPKVSSFITIGWQVVDTWLQSPHDTFISS